MKNNVLIIDCSHGNFIGLITEQGESFISDLLLKSDLILASVEQILKENNLSLDNLSAVAVNIGPGSFTGLRVGVTIAKGLSIVKNIPVISYTSFEAIIANLRRDEKNPVIVLEGFSDYYYIKHKKEECLEKSDIVEILEKTQNSVLCNEKVAKNLNFAKFQPINTLPFNAVKAKMLDNQFTSVNDLEPVYLRASQAEIERDKKWKSLQKHD